MMHQPFKTPMGNYIYDGNTNALMSVLTSEFDSLVRIKRNEANENDFCVLENFQKQGLCKEPEIEEIKHPQADYLEQLLTRKVEKLTLQVTQNCNLRCAYCTYSGSYANRVHNNKRMSFKTAKNAIDFLVENSADVPSINVSFYGGEPLLEFDLIKKCLKYIKENYNGKKFTYNITTNATLLNDEIVEFFMDNNVSLSISLDGPQEIHDANRTFVNGEGSFKTIMKNLLHIKERYPEFYPKVSILSVLSPKSDIKCYKEFYNLDETMEMLNVLMSTVAPNYSQNEIHYEEATQITIEHEMFKILLACLGKIDNKHISKVFVNRRASIFTNYKNLKRTSGLPKQVHPGGPCIAGKQRLFVNADGNFYPCERVSEESEAMKIGNLDTGFDFEKAAYITNVGKITEEECKKCWAFTRCTSCAAVCDDLSSNLSREMRLKQCHSVKNNVMSDLLDICFLREHGYDFIEEGEYIND